MHIKAPVLSFLPPQLLYLDIRQRPRLGGLVCTAEEYRQLSPKGLLWVWAAGVGVGGA